MNKRLKKSFTAIILAFVILLGTAIPSMALSVANLKSEEASGETNSLFNFDNFFPKIIAHRGYSGKYPQNTIPAFEGAIEAGFWGMECDIHTTKDGKWVVIHDDEISNLTNGEGYVKNLTFEEIQNIQMDSGNGIDKYGTLPIPTLEEYLDVCLTADIVPVIEIKSCDIKYIPSLKKILDSYGLSEKTVLISFTREYLKAYRELEKNITMFLLVHEPTEYNIDFCIKYNMGINYNYQNVLKCYSGLAYAKKNNVPIAAWTVDSVIVATFLWMLGADYITTNKLKPLF